MVPDNLSTYTTPDLQTWLAKDPHVTFHFTPRPPSKLADNNAK